MTLEERLLRVAEENPNVVTFEARYGVEKNEVYIELSDDVQTIDARAVFTFGDDSMHENPTVAVVAHYALVGVTTIVNEPCRRE